MDSEKAHQVLSIVAESGYLAPRDLFVCQEFCARAFVSFEQKVISWKNTRDRMHICDHNDNPKVGSRTTFEYDKKDKINKLASTTYAKQKLKLSDEDLKPLDFEMVYIKAARSYFPFYLRKDLYTTMLLKHGLDYIPHYDKEANFDYIILPRCYRLYEARMQHLMHIFSFFDSPGINLRRALFIRRNLHTRQFLQNGKDKKKIDAYAKRLQEQNTFVELKKAFPKISWKELSRLCEKMYDDQCVDIKSIIHDHTIDLNMQHHLRVRMKQIASSPFQRDLHRIIPNSLIYDVHEDFASLEAYVQRYKQRETDIQESPMRRIIHSYVCPFITRQTLEIPMEELVFRAQEYAQREEDLKKMPCAHEIKMRFPSACMDLSIPLASLELQVREVHDRRAYLEDKLREKGLELRQDSTTCRDFIEKRRNDIDEVVAIMEEMNWFFTYTNYRYIIQDYYAELRYYDSDTSDEEREWKSREDISHECKTTAFHRFQQLRQRSLEEFDANVHVDPAWSPKRQKNYIDSKNQLRKKIQKAKQAPLIERICQIYG